MIRSLEGTIVRQNPLHVVVTVHNIGYLVYTNVARHTYAVGDIILFHTHLAVRENALDLYGFVEEKELVFFELLLTIPKIGPKSALQILCQADPELLGTAIMLGDAEHLHKVSGIGKKTATNIVTHLAGKIDPTFTPNLTHVGTAPELTPSQKDAIDALITLGYDQKEANVFILKLDKSLDAKTLIQSVLTQKPM
jgi:holliday junction DNA helicase RuvA